MRIESSNLSAVAPVLVASSSMTLSRVQGFFGAGANGWLQLHDTKVTPITGTIKRSWPVYTNAPFDQNFQNDPLRLNTGCTLAISSAEAAYANIASAFDLYISGVATFDTTGLSTTGDYTTGVNARTGWTTSANTNVLRRIELTALTNGGALFMKVYGVSPAAGIFPIVSEPLVANTTYDFMFNVHPFMSISGTITRACYIRIESTGGVYSSAYAGTDYAVKISYK